jgi:hypothetical protein
MSLLSLILRRERTCPACGAPFVCGGLGGCWCREVTLDPSALAELRNRYSGCLCRSCLEKWQRDSLDHHLTTRGSSGIT